MAKKKKDFYRSGSYDEMLVRSENTDTGKDFFADDDLEEAEAADYAQQEQGDSAVRVKMDDIRNAVSERKQKLRDKGIITAKTGHRRSAAPIGVLFTLFALIGLGTVIYLISSGISGWINDESRLKVYDDIIAPVVFFDPDTFETCQDPKMEKDILTISVWTTHSKNPDGFEVNADNGRTIIPTADVMATAQRLFGPNVKLNYNAFSDEEGESASCIWNESDGTIEVLLANFEGFSHKVLDISKKKNTVTCTVGYISSYADESDNTYAKVMLYILTKNPATKEYYISAIREMQ